MVTVALAVFSNVSTIVLVGTMSPTTYNVIGHLKNVLILGLG